MQMPCPGTPSFPAVTEAVQEHTRGLPLRHIPALRLKETSSCLQLFLSSSLFKMAKCVVALQHERSCKMWNYVIVVKEVYKLLNTMCWPGRAFQFPLLDKRLVSEHLLCAKKGNRRLWLSPVSQNGWFFWCWLQLSSQYLSPLLLFGV